MTREARIRSAGILFYIVLLVTLLLTQEGVQFTTDILNNVSENTEDTQNAENRDWAGTLVAVATLGTAVLTSDAIGWVFSEITMCILTKGRPGYFYAMEWGKITCDLKGRIIENYERPRDPQHSDKDAGLDERWKGYSADVFLSYFWQQGPEKIVQWVSRRYTRFFITASSVCGMALALGLSIFLMWRFSLGMTVWWCCAVVISIAVMVSLRSSGAVARNEARQMVDIWLRAAFDEPMKTALNTMKQALLLEKREATIRRKTDLSSLLR